MAKCAECGKQAEARFAPFCSARCQQIDLGRWLKGDYAIPGRPDEAEAVPGRQPPARDGDDDPE